jgi:hypothetical protein
VDLKAMKKTLTAITANSLKVPTKLAERARYCLYGASKRELTNMQVEALLEKATQMTKKSSKIVSKNGDTVDVVVGKLLDVYIRADAIGVETPEMKRAKHFLRAEKVLSKDGTVAPPPPPDDEDSLPPPPPDDDDDAQPPPPGGGGNVVSVAKAMKSSDAAKKAKKEKRSSLKEKKRKDSSSSKRKKASKKNGGDWTDPTPEYEQLMSVRGHFPLCSFAGLRTEQNYLKRTMKRRKGLKSVIHSHQQDDIPRSLINDSDKDAAERGAYDATSVSMFAAVRQYMRDDYHPYPATMAAEALATARGEPVLRDELFCQIIKQVTDNPNESSLYLGWKLMYFALRSFEPEGELRDYVRSVIAEALPTDRMPVVADSSDTSTPFAGSSVCRVALLCWRVLEASSGGSELPLDFIKKLTDATRDDDE